MVPLEHVSTILRFFSIPDFTRFEVVFIQDSDNYKRMYVLINKEHFGFRMVEIEREIVIPLIDNELNLIDWNFDLDT